MNIKEIKEKIEWHTAEIARLQRLLDAQTTADCAAAGNAGREPGDFITIDRDDNRLKIHIGKALYRAVGTPKRFDIQRVGTQLMLIAVYTGDNGFAVSGGVETAPKIACKKSDDIVRLDAGRYAATAHDTKIIIGDAL